MSREAKLPKSAAQAKEFRGAHLGLEPKPAAARAFARSPLRCHPSAQSSAWHMAGPRQGSGTRKEGRGCPAAGKAMGSAILGWGPCQSPRLSQAESRPDSQEMGPQHGAAPGGDGPPTRGGRGRLLPGDKHRCERLLPTADLLTGRRDPVFSTLSAERPHRAGSRQDGEGWGQGPETSRVRPGVGAAGDGLCRCRMDLLLSWLILLFSTERFGSCLMHGRSRDNNENEGD